MFLAEHDSERVEVEPGVGPGALHIRRLRGGELRWEREVELAEWLLERLERPSACAVDARFGAAGELYLIVQARDGERLPVPRELWFGDGPELLHVRAGADCEALEGSARILQGTEPALQILDESKDRLVVVDVTRGVPRQIYKHDDVLAGSVTRVVEYGHWKLRIVREHDDHVLAVVAGTAVAELGWLRGPTQKSALIGYRWFRRQEFAELAPSEPCPLCARGKQSYVAGMSVIAIDNAASGEARHVYECGYCLERWDVTARGANDWTWEARGKRVRATHGTPEPAAVPPTMEEVLVANRELVLVDGAIRRTLEVVQESADMYWLEAPGGNAPQNDLLALGFEMVEDRGRYGDEEPYYHYRYLRVHKTDARISGPFVRTIRRGDCVLRVAVEREQQLLVVAQADLAAQLCMFTGTTSAGMIGYRWMETAPRARPPSTPMISRTMTPRPAIAPVASAPAVLPSPTPVISRTMTPQPRGPVASPPAVLPASSAPKLPAVVLAKSDEPTLKPQLDEPPARATPLPETRLARPAQRPPPPRAAPPPVLERAGVRVEAATDEPGSLLVQTQGWRRHVHVLDAYEDRFQHAQVRALEIRDDHELGVSVLAEAYDCSPAGPWPPREFVFDAARPVIRRSRPSAHVDVLTANVEILYGPANRTFAVAAEDRETLTLYDAGEQKPALVAVGFTEAVEDHVFVYRLTIAKDDKRLVGPHRWCATYMGQRLRVAELLGEHLLLVAEPEYARRLGMEVWRGPTTRSLGYRWVPFAKVDRNCASCAATSRETPPHMFRSMMVRPTAKLNPPVFDCRCGSCGKRWDVTLLDGTAWDWFARGY